MAHVYVDDVWVLIADAENSFYRARSCRITFGASNALIGKNVSLLQNSIIYSKSASLLKLSESLLFTKCLRVLWHLLHSNIALPHEGQNTSCLSIFSRSPTN